MGRFENHFFVDKNLELCLYFVHCCCFLNSFFFVYILLQCLAIWFAQLFFFFMFTWIILAALSLRICMLYYYLTLRCPPCSLVDWRLGNPGYESHFHRKRWDLWLERRISVVAEGCECSRRQPSSVLLFRSLSTHALLQIKKSSLSDKPVAVIPALRPIWGVFESAPLAEVHELRAISGNAKSLKAFIAL